MQIIIRQSCSHMSVQSRYVRTLNSWIQDLKTKRQVKDLASHGIQIKFKILECLQHIRSGTPELGEWRHGHAPVYSCEGKWSRSNPPNGQTEENCGTRWNKYSFKYTVHFFQCITSQHIISTTFSRLGRTFVTEKSQKTTEQMLLDVNLGIFLYYVVTTLQRWMHSPLEYFPITNLNF